MSDERDYYVSMIRDSRYALMAGPFATHAEALAFVGPVRKEASRLDPFSDFDAFGTCSKPRCPDNKTGRLNVHVGARPRSISFVEADERGAI